MKYLNLACLVGLIFNCGTTQEFKNPFLYVNIHGQSTEFSAVTSNVFFALASKRFFQKWNLIDLDLIMVQTLIQADLLMFVFERRTSFGMIYFKTNDHEIIVR